MTVKLSARPLKSDLSVKSCGGVSTALERRWNAQGYTPVMFLQNHTRNRTSAACSVLYALSTRYLLYVRVVRVQHQQRHIDILLYSYKQQCNMQRVFNVHCGRWGQRATAGLEWILNQSRKLILEILIEVPVKRRRDQWLIILWSSRLPAMQSSDRANEPIRVIRQRYTSTYE